MRKLAELMPLIAVLLVVFLPPPSDAEAISEKTSGLLHVLEIDQSEYTFDDSVHIWYSVTNSTEEPITVPLWYDLCPVWVYIYDPGGARVWSDPMGCFCSAGPRTLMPGEAWAREPIWGICDYNGQQLDEPGVYTVEGEITSCDSNYYALLQLQIVIVESLTGLPESGAGRPTTWATVKALFR